MARRSKEAIRRASASTKPPSSASGSARLTYPYRSAVSPSKSFAPRTISSARPRPARAGVYPNEQILEALEYSVVYHVERRIVEHDPPVRSRFLDDPHVRW